MSVIVIVKGCAFVFGKPPYTEIIERDLKREGFTVEARENTWMRAKGRRRSWFIEERGGHWILSMEGAFHTRLALKAKRERRSWSDDLRQSSSRPHPSCVRSDVYTLAIKKA